MDRIEVDKMKAMVSQIVSEEANQKLEREQQASETFKPIVDEIKKEVEEISKLREEYKLIDEGNVKAIEGPEAKAT